MVGGNDVHRRVIHGEISRVLVLNLSGKQAVLTHRPGELCPWQCLRSYRGPPADINSSTCWTKGRDRWVCAKQSQIVAMLSTEKVSDKLWSGKYVAPESRYSVVSP